MDAVQPSAWSVRSDYSVSLGNERPGYGFLSQGKTRLASPNTACGGHFPASTVKQSFQGSWDGRDSGEVRTVTEYEVPLAWLG